MNNIKIAVDGPAGVGKSSLAKLIAKAGGFTYIDSGAMYRAVGIYCIEKGISADSAVMVGGPSEAPLWAELIAARLGVSVHTGYGAYSGAVGAARLAVGSAEGKNV